MQLTEKFKKKNKKKSDGRIILNMISFLMWMLSRGDKHYCFSFKNVPYYGIIVFERLKNTFMNYVILTITFLFLSVSKCTAVENLS